MGSEAKRRERRNRWLLGAEWATGIGITLVEMQMGVDYVLAHIAGHVSAVVGWLPMIGTLVRQLWG
jgi:hypothetical protein